MSWKDKLENIPLEITTGDGQVYTPLWRLAEKEVPFNTDRFDFVGIDGSYVERKRMSGRIFPFTLFFQGEDNIEQATAFESSARDVRPWTIQHPYYNVIRCHPVEMRMINTAHNVTRVTLTVWETLPDKFPADQPNSRQKVINNKQALNEASAELGAAQMGVPSASVIDSAQGAVGDINQGLQKIIQAPRQAQKLINRYNAAMGATGNIVSNSFQALVATQQLIDIIADPDIAKISDKINAFQAITKSIKGRLNGADSAIVYETNMTTLISAISVAAVQGNYPSRREVLDVISTIDAVYVDYLHTFDSIEFEQQTGTALSLDGIVYETLANLYIIAYNAKQTRVHITQKATNPVVLAHQFFGPGDENLSSFIEQNNLSLNELIQIDKNREIRYLV